jgi:DNA-binding GntR family transcriptional regulator
MTSTESNAMYGESNRQLVYDHLHDAMARGDYPPGTRLINRTIAKELGTSFAPVREAICQLFSDGLLEMQPGIGAYVIVPDRREIEELLVLREELEGRAAQEAARHITARQLDRLQSICDQWKEILRNRISADGRLDPLGLVPWVKQFF